MVADDTHLHGHHNVKAFAWVWAVPDDITETKDALATLRLNVGQNCGEGFKVPVEKVSGKSSTGLGGVLGSAPAVSSVVEIGTAAVRA
jgi:hypothetical protein